MADPIASASTSNGLGYSSKREVDMAASSTIAAPKQVEEGSEEQLEIRIEFGGGLHLLFSQQPRHTVRIPRYTPSPTTTITGGEADAWAGAERKGNPATMRDLISLMKRTILSEREEMFGEGDGVRPGILVLINDADWELEGELEYELRNRDEVVFISTLHGG